MIRLITGGVRSGKSRFAEELCRGRKERVVYLATGWTGDREMEARVEAHRRRRPPEWQLVEEPVRLSERIAEWEENGVLLVDCVSTWVANRLMELPEEAVEADRGEFVKQMGEEAEKMIRALAGKEAVLVTSEVGLGGVSMSKMGRMFQDALGTVNQMLAREAGEVWFVVSGIPWRIKG